MPLDNSQKKGQNLFGILVSSLQLNTFIIVFSLDIYNFYSLFIFNYLYY